MCLLIILASSCSMAAYTAPTDQNKVSVAQLKDVTDDSWATLEGALVKRLSEERNLFHDATSDVVAEIATEV